MAGSRVFVNDLSRKTGVILFPSVELFQRISRRRRRRRRREWPGFWFDEF